MAQLEKQADMILNFKEEIKNFSLSQLKQMQEKIQSGISKMILDSDLIIKAAIIEQAIALAGEGNNLIVKDAVGFKEPGHYRTDIAIGLNYKR